MGTFFSRASLIKGLERDGIRLIGFAVRCFMLSLINYKSPFETFWTHEESVQEKLWAYVQECHNTATHSTHSKPHLCPYGKALGDALQKSNAYWKSREGNQKRKPGRWSLNPCHKEGSCEFLALRVSFRPTYHKAVEKADMERPSGLGENVCLSFKTWNQRNTMQSKEECGKHFPGMERLKQLFEQLGKLKW